MSEDPFSSAKTVRPSRARETIEAILQASRQIVSRQGIAGLTTNHVAELAGVSIGTLYQYFPGKDAVLHAVIEREQNRSADKFVADMLAIDPTKIPLREAIAQIIDLAFDAQFEHRPFYRQLLLAALSFKHLRFTLDNDARLLAALREKLIVYGDGVDQESFELATFVVHYAMKGVQLGVAFGNGAHDEPRLRALLIRLAYACIATDRGPQSA